MIVFNTLAAQQCQTTEISLRQICCYTANDFMKRSVAIVIFVFATCVVDQAHNVGNAITWNREVSRIFYQHCASCHHEGGSAFSMMKYPDVQPRAVAIKEAVLSRRMPPWGAVKGFGEFANDQGLSEEELSLITDWVDSDTPRGTNPNVLPKEPKFEKESKVKPPKNGIIVSGDYTLHQAATIGGLMPEKIPSRSSMKVFAALPNGTIEPMIWFYEYTDAFKHSFLFRKPLNLPGGTVIHGVPSNASIVLLPRSKAKSSK
jgi:hypothetical protein